MKRALQIRTPFKIERTNKSGFRGLRINDADGLGVCNLVFKLDDSEAEMAEAICRAVNKAHPPKRRSRKAST